MYMFVVGSVKSYGVLYTELLGYFGGGSGNTAWVGSLCMLLMLGLGKQPWSPEGDEFYYSVISMIK